MQQNRKKYRNNRVDSDHAGLKRLFGNRQSLRSLRAAKATQQGMEIMRTIKDGHIHNRSAGVRGEVAFVHHFLILRTLNQCGKVKIRVRPTNVTVPSNA
ncbi:MAG: DDE-type integrase/transposase/recombinase [Paracoccaceae bacterium]